MPGTSGEIRVQLGSSGFIRWEVRNETSLPANANPQVVIGGPGKWWTRPANSFAFVRIDMFDDKDVPIDGDVYIRAVDTRQPVWRTNLQDGTVGDEDSGGYIDFATADTGGGGRLITWELISNDFIPGMDFSRVGNTTLIMSDPGGPTKIGMFPFTLGINLPGSMQIHYSDTMVINDVPGVMLGDVNGDGQRNLADLVHFARFLRGQIPALNNPDAGNIVSEKGTRPRGDDLDIIASYFARPNAALAPPPSLPPSPPPGEDEEE